MPELIPCPSCGRHVVEAEKCCPYCGKCAKKGHAASAAMIGLALMAGACNDKGTAPENDYGVPAYGDTGDTGDTAED